MPDFKSGDRMHLDGGPAAYEIADVLRFTDSTALWATITNPDWPRGRTVEIDRLVHAD